MAETTNEPGGDFLSKVQGALEQSVGKITDALATNLRAGDIAKVIQEIDDKATTIVKSFGQGRENIVNLKAAMADAASEVERMGGSFDDIVSIQKDVAESLGRNLILTSSSYKDIYATSEVTGQNAKELVTNFKDAGMSVYQVTGEMSKVVNIAREAGVNAQAVSGEVLKNMSSLNQFNFAGGVSGLAKMAAQAALLRVDMGSTLKLADELFSPDKAIELAASMQRLGVANSELLDPLRLMDMAQNDPAELQNQISKMSEQFVQLGKDGKFEIMPGAKRQLMEVEKAMGMSKGELSKMALASAEVADKMQKIKFPSSFTEEEKGLIAGMAEMGAGGEYKIQLGGKELGITEAISELQKDPDQMKALKEMAQPKSMEELAKDQLTISKSMDASLKSMSNRTGRALAGTKVANQALEAPKLLYDAAAESLSGDKVSSRNLRSGLGTGAEEVLGSINKLFKGEGSMSETFNVVKGTMENTANFMKGAYAEALDKGAVAASNLAKEQNIFLEILQNGGKKLGETFMKVEKIPTKTTATPESNPTTVAKDMLKLPGQNVQFLPEDTLASFTKGKEVLSALAGSNNRNENNGNDTPAPRMTESGPVNINLNITAPPNIDTAQLMLAFENSGVKEAMVTAVTKGRYNNGLTSPTSNQAQLMEMASMRV
jgi:archaellum component FlaC